MKEVGSLPFPAIAKCGISQIYSLKILIEYVLMLRFF